MPVLCEGTSRMTRPRAIVQVSNGENYFDSRLMSGVENRRSSGSLPVAFVSAAFAERASIRFGMALFPVLAHRTGQAHLAHPALGESFTISPTEGCLSE